MKYREAYRKALEQLNEAGVENPDGDTRYLLEAACSLTRAGLLLKEKEDMSAADEKLFFEYIKRRAAHEPCQYIVGSTEFMGLGFKVDEAVLIPRQDTETLCEKAIEVIKTAGAKSMLDLCTGSGAIAVSIKHFCPELIVSASDISKEALSVARENAHANGVEIDFIQSDMFTSIEGEFDIILSNPPYVTEAEYKSLEPEVRDHEPIAALVAGADGLDCYRVIAREAAAHITPHGHLVLEIGCFQAEAVSGLLKDDFEDIEVVKDLAGKDRVVCCRRKDK